MDWLIPVLMAYLKIKTSGSQWHFVAFTKFLIHKKGDKYM